MAQNLENQKEASSSAEDVKPQRVLLLEQFVKKVKHSIPKVDDFLSKIITTHKLDIKPMNMEFLKVHKFVEVWFCLISPHMTKENSLIFEDGSCLTKQQLELIYGIDFVNEFVQFLLSLQTFTQIELKLFTCVAVLSRRYSNNMIPGKLHFFDNDIAAQNLRDFCVGFFDFDISKKILKLYKLVEQHNIIMEWFSKNYWRKLDLPKITADRMNISISVFKGLSGPSSLEAQKIDSWNEWVHAFTLYMHQQMSFVDACLESLTNKDQACLLKHGLIELFFFTDLYFMTGKSIEFRPTGYLKEYLEVMYGLDFLNAFLETLLSLKSCQLSPLEMKIFREIVLLNQRPGLIDVEAVQKLQDRAIEKFSEERLKNQKNANGVDILTFDIPKMLSDLQALSLLQLESIDWLKENSSKVKLSPFVCELYDIPYASLKNDLTGPSSIEEQKINLWNEWVVSLTFYTKGQMSFVHARLTSLTKKDIACLFKHSLIELYFCTLLRFMSENSIEFGLAGDLKQYLEVMYGVDFLKAFMETLLSLKACQLSTLEMKLFREIVLTDQRPGIVDVEVVQKLQDRAIEKFSAERLKNQKNTNGVDIPTFDIPKMLSDLRALSLLQLESIDWLKENSSKIRLSPLVRDVFDIPNEVKFPEANFGEIEMASTFVKMALMKI